MSTSTFQYLPTSGGAFRELIDLNVFKHPLPSVIKTEPPGSPTADYVFVALDSDKKVNRADDKDEGTNENGENKDETGESSNQSNLTQPVQAEPETMSITHCHNTSVLTLRAKPAGSSIVLFTPVIIPPDPDEFGLRGENPMDPFEHFGRALSKHHPVLHVPYVPSVGFNAYHAQMFTVNRYFIVVTAPPQLRTELAFNRQANFVENVCHIIRKKHITVGYMWLVQFGEPDARPAVRGTCQNIVVASRYSKNMAKRIADELFIHAPTSYFG